MQEHDGKRLLKTAIQDEHRGAQESARFTRAIGCAVIDLGLQQLAGHKGFKLVPVAFTNVGIAIATLKKNSSVANSSIATIIEKLQLHQYFSFVADAKSEKHLSMHMAKVLPHASHTVKSLLPFAWSSLQQQTTVGTAVPNHKAELSQDILTHGSGSRSSRHESKVPVKQGSTHQQSVSQQQIGSAKDSLLSSRAAVCHYLLPAA